MELFSASSDEQFKYIKRVIDDSDYYVLIIKNRYGSINTKTNKSYTEMEFEYAKEKKLPILAFVHNDSEKAIEESGDKSFSDFIDKVKDGRLIKYWTDANNLKTEVFMCLSEAFQDYPQQGWQRFEDKSSLLEKLNTIRKEKDELITKLKEYNARIDNIAEMDEAFELHFTYHNDSRGYSSAMSGHGKISATWNDIFSYIAPKMISPYNASSFKYLIDTKFINKIAEKKYDKIYLEDDDANTIKIQFHALCLINAYPANTAKT
jgi:hypothetical protein